MNIIKTLAAALLLTGSTVSCTNLTSEMYDTINTGIFPKTTEDAKSLVLASAYGPFRACWWSGLYQSGSGGIQVYTEMTTDIGDCQWDDPLWNDLRKVNFTSNSSGIVSYQQYINFISKMTLTLERIANINMDEAEKTRLNGELHCGRGWLAYVLYDLYGPIQVASSAQLNDPLNDDPAPRLSHDEMVKFIEDDLKAAIDVLPARYDKSDSNYGSFTRGLAYTVLMKLYMHEKEWQKAADCGKELAKPEYGLGLMDHYKDIFTLENEGNKEAIWSCICDASENAQMWLAHVLSSPFPTKNENIQKWGGYRVPWSFYHTFDPADERLQVLIGDFQGTDGHHYTEDSPGSVLIKGALPIKYGEDPSATGEESQIDWIVFRYADVLTLRAEALARANNAVTQEALDCLNAVHQRAGLPAFKLSDFASTDDFLEAVLLERGHELWFEGARRTDLIRYGKYIEYAKKYKGSTTAKDYMTLMPLPQSVIDESKGKIAQNPGY